MTCISHYQYTCTCTPVTYPANKEGTCTWVHVHVQLIDVCMYPLLAGYVYYIPV